MIIEVRHNIEVAHRLWQLEGNKCQQIHGHSMWVQLGLEVSGMKNGIAQNSKGEKLDFGSVKKIFRTHLDRNFDHHLLLNENDEFAQELRFTDPSGTEWKTHLPGLYKFPGDPSTENIALEIKRWAEQTFTCRAKVQVQETYVNGVIV